MKPAPLLMPPTENRASLTVSSTEMKSLNLVMSAHHTNPSEEDFYKQNWPVTFPKCH